jgi:uncharacterized protein
MNPTLEILVKYLARVVPGVILGLITLLLIRRQPRLRIVLYLVLFILLRDAMTPLRLWSFGTSGFFWIRVSSDPWFLVVFGLASLGITLAVYHFDRANQSLVRWTRGKPLSALVWGIGGAILVVAPLAVSYRSTLIESRGGSVPFHSIPAILIFAMLGNFLEETLFRGYVYGHLAESMTSIRAGISSGVVFAFCHIFLATTVTDINYPLLVFTLWEGIIAGIVGARGGVIPATLTHGGAIFLLSSGLI